jgi:hypothetical protein
MRHTRTLLHFLRQRTATFGCAMLVAAMFCCILSAQNQLVTIQDTLFMADGIRFNGTLFIRWNTFDTNSGTIIQQSRTVVVSNGNLQVQLAANASVPAPANSYSVAYQSDGREQFSEAWTVPQVSRSLKVAEVRTGTFSTSSGSGSVGNQTPIPISSVVGLVADLAQRPTKGPGFGTGSVAVINQSGQIETAAGNVGDCVYVDGTAGACGGASPQFFDAETPGGVVDGTNPTFTLTNPPSGASLQLFRNGMYMKSGFDYTLTNSSVEFVTGAKPQPGDTLVASYRIDPSAGNIGNLESGSIGRRTPLAQIICSSTGRTNGGNYWASLGACDIPATSLRPGDRFEIRFNYMHKGSNAGFDAQVLWGTTAVVLRHGSTLDAALVGRAEASVTATGAQITAESWGTVLPLLPAIISSGVQNGLKLDILGKLDAEGTDTIGASYTVLRYPAN